MTFENLRRQDMFVSLLDVVKRSCPDAVVFSCPHPPVLVAH